MSSVILTGDTSGTITVSAPAVAGSNTVTLPAATGTISLLQMGTAVASTSGTSIDFTGSPSWAKRITVMFNGVSINTANHLLIQLGTSSGVENKGYVSTSTAGSTTVTTITSTGGFISYVAGAAISVSGLYIFSNVSGNIWVGSSTTSPGATFTAFGGGGKTLASTLDRVRITTDVGTATFDAGSINVMWEG